MNLVWVILLIVGAACVGIGAMLLVRRGAPDGSYFNDGDRAAGVFGVLATGFSVLLGFVVFLAFTSYDDSRRGAEDEARVVTQQFETAQFMPRAAAGPLGDQLVCYARAIVHQEWPRMESGNLGDHANPWGIALFKSLKRTDPKTATEQAAYSKWLDQTSDREGARLDRIHGAQGVIPSPVWVVLLLIAVVIFFFMLFFADSGERAVVQAVLMGSVVVVIGITMAVILALDSPFRRGPGSIRPVAMERTLRFLDQERRIVGRSGPLPCDANGLATS